MNATWLQDGESKFGFLSKRKMKKEEVEEGDCRLVGEVIPHEEARQRWPERYEPKVYRNWCCSTFLFNFMIKHRQMKGFFKCHFGHLTHSRVLYVILFNFLSIPHRLWTWFLVLLGSVFFRLYWYLCLDFSEEEYAGFWIKKPQRVSLSLWIFCFWANICDISLDFLLG